MMNIVYPPVPRPLCANKKAKLCQFLVRWFLALFLLFFIPLSNLRIILFLAVISLCLQGKDYVKTLFGSPISEVFSCILKYPDFGSRNLAEKTGVSRLSIDRFRILVRELDLTPDRISLMFYCQINTLFKRKEKRDDFVILYWEEIRKYLDTPRKWNGHLNTIKNA